MLELLKRVLNGGKILVDWIASFSCHYPEWLVTVENSNRSIARTVIVLENFFKNYFIVKTTKMGIGMNCNGLLFHIFFS